MKQGKGMAVEAARAKDLKRTVTKPFRPPAPKGSGKKQQE